MLIPLILVNLFASFLMAIIVYNNLYDTFGPSAAPGVNLKLSVSVISMMLFATGLYIIYKSCVMFINRGYFNAKSALYLKRGAYILILKAVLSIVWISIHINTNTFDDKESQSELVLGISREITFLIIGFAIITVSDIVKKGENIKRENDLTI